MGDRQNLLFDKFEIVNCLKKDMQSGVYVANHIFLGRTIILKTLDTEQIDDPSILDRFKREAKILAQLNHDHIIKVFDFGTFNNYFYISFEYFPGQNLRKALASNNYSVTDKLSLLKQLVKAINVAHKSKIIHRDLKPENVLVNNELTLKLADFGLAHVDDETRLTMQNALIGTPAYMSPEQINGEDISVKSDIFSLGIIIYELFTGSHPFMGKDAAETLKNILKGYTNRLAAEVRSLPTELQEIISGCLQKEPSNRFKSIDEIIIRLDKISTTCAIPDSEVKKKNKKLWLIPVAAAVAIPLIMAVFTYLHRDEIPAITMNMITYPPESIMPDTVDLSHRTLINVKKKDIEYDQDGSQTLRANVTADSQKLTSAMNIKPGRLLVKCDPWAYIYLNESKIDSTPLNDPIILSPNIYTLKLIHPDYPPFIRHIKIIPDSILEVKVDLDTLMGFLHCNVYPWAEVFIDEKEIGQTPFKAPIKLNAGEYLLTIKNPKYEDYSERIRISKNDTFDFKFDFKNHPIKVSSDSILHGL